MPVIDISQLAVSQLLNKQHPSAKSMRGFWVAGAGPRGNTWHDLTDGRHHGPLINGPTWSSQAPPGGFGSLSFIDDSDAFVSLDYDWSTILIPPFASFVRWLADTDHDGRILSHSVDDKGHHIWIKNNEVGWGYYDGTWHSKSTAFATDGKWHSITGSIDSDKVVTAYLDRVEMSGSSTAGTPPGYLKIGHGAGGPLVFNGLIESVGIIDRTISLAEIRALYDELPRGYPNLLDRGRRSVYPAAVAGGATVTPGALSATWSVPSPTLIETATPAASTVTWSVAAPTCKKTVAPAAVTVTWSVPAPTLIKTRSASAVSVSWSTPAPTVRKTTQPASLGLAWTVPVPTTGTIVTPSALSVTWSVPSPTLRKTAAPASLGLPWGVPSPALKEAISVAPASATWSVPAPTQRKSVSPTPLSVSWTAPACTLQKTIRPGAMAVTWSAPTPTATVEGVAMPGPEYTVPSGRLHYTVPEGKLHATVPPGRLHYTVPPED